MSDESISHCHEWIVMIVICYSSSNCSSTAELNKVHFFIASIFVSVVHGAG
jgi:hypothetical protein